MPNFKFLRQFSTQVSSGGFNNQVGTKTIPQGTVLSGNYVDNKTTGSKEVSIILSYVAIQGATTNVNVPLNLVVETTEPVSKTFYGAWSMPFDNPNPPYGLPKGHSQGLLNNNQSGINPTKKYIFLRDYPNSNNPKFKKGDIGIGQESIMDYGVVYIKIGVPNKGDEKILTSHPLMMFEPILKEIDNQPEYTTNKNKEKPTTTEKQTFFSKKNITTGVFVLVGIGATLAILKWKKII